MKPQINFNYSGQQGGSVPATNYVSGANYNIPNRTTGTSVQSNQYSIPNRTSEVPVNFNRQISNERISHNVSSPIHVSSPAHPTISQQRTSYVASPPPVHYQQTSGPISGNYQTNIQTSAVRPGYQQSGVVEERVYDNRGPIVNRSNSSQYRQTQPVQEHRRYEEDTETSNAEVKTKKKKKGCGWLLPCLLAALALALLTLLILFLTGVLKWPWAGDNNSGAAVNADSEQGSVSIQQTVVNTTQADAQANTQSTKANTYTNPDQQDGKTSTVKPVQPVVVPTATNGVVQGKTNTGFQFPPTTQVSPSTTTTTTSTTSTVQPAYVSPTTNNNGYSTKPISVSPISVSPISVSPISTSPQLRTTQPVYEYSTLPNYER